MRSAVGRKQQVVLTQYSAVRFRAATIFSTEGMWNLSSGAEKGIAVTLGAVTRTIGASRQSKPSSAMTAETSAPMPRVRWS